MENICKGCGKVIPSGDTFVQPRGWGTSPPSYHKNLECILAGEFLFRKLFTLPYCAGCGYLLKEEEEVIEIKEDHYKPYFVHTKLSCVISGVKMNQREEGLQFRFMKWANDIHKPVGE